MYEAEGRCEVLPGLLYFHWMGIFHLPVAQGKPSPFDSPYF
jgi:hypothetical protein